ncbi:unnamed protein product [Ceratitis capitata]|uniref:(Mediterranean fruit fly) hypothetical protein n=1 Tax=Ceratitis capitata TaxID=7213 RepID=A0A811UXU2_CERCA|nr:unnamed protein product [Ceratitis capitata]
MPRAYILQSGAHYRRTHSTAQHCALLFHLLPALEKLTFIASVHPPAAQHRKISFHDFTSGSTQPPIIKHDNTPRPYLTLPGLVFQGYVEAGVAANLVVAFVSCSC